MVTNFNELSNGALLSMLLKDNSQERISALFNKVTLSGVEELSVDELKEMGFTKSKIQQIFAIFEFIGRYNLSNLKRLDKISCPEDILNAMTFLRYEKKEHFYVLLLDTKNNLIRKELISLGTLNSSVVHPREVMKPAIKSSAAAIIVCHNHPSGNPSPSKEDKEITERLLKAADIIGIKLLDHIIIGNRNYFSFKEDGLI